MRRTFWHELAAFALVVIWVLLSESTEPANRAAAALAAVMLGVVMGSTVSQNPSKKRIVRVVRPVLAFAVAFPLAMLLSSSDTDEGTRQEMLKWPRMLQFILPVLLGLTGECVYRAYWSRRRKPRYHHPS